MTLWDFFCAPFVDFQFMRRALVGCIALALGGGPVGLLLVLRRMSLMTDAMSHAVLPGAALGFLLFGLSLPAMSVGGFVAGVLVALLAAWVTRMSNLKEDASFAAFYLIALALGVLLISSSGSQVDLLRFLFGSVLAMDGASLLLMATVASVTLLALAVIYRPLMLDALDPIFLQLMTGRRTHWAYTVFLLLVVANLVAGFQTLGTLMSVGLMLLPAIAARLWAARMGSMLLLTWAFAALAGLVGLLISYHWELASGPAIIAVAGGIYVLSIVFGRVGGVVPQRLRRRHFQRGGA